MHAFIRRPSEGSPGRRHRVKAMCDGHTANCFDEASSIKECHATLVLPRLGWRFPGAPMELEALVGACLGPAPVHLRSTTALPQCICSPCLATIHRPAHVLEKDQATLATLLLPLSNKGEEVLWRLILDALPTAVRLHKNYPCICGAPAPDRMHHLWSLPEHVGLVAVLSDHRRLWECCPLLLLPLRVFLGYHNRSCWVWRVVCLATNCAICHVLQPACATAFAGMAPVTAIEKA